MFVHVIMFTWSASIIVLGNNEIVLKAIICDYMITVNQQDQLIQATLKWSFF